MRGATHSPQARKLALDDVALAGTLAIRRSSGAISWVQRKVVTYLRRPNLRRPRLGGPTRTGTSLKMLCT
jgi:hypothetical protein